MNALRRPPGGKLTDDYLGEVVAAYWAAMQSGSRPGPTIAAAAGVSPRTVHGWLEKARDRGLLPPTRRGGGGTPLHFVYECWAGEVPLYVGQTDDLGRRLREHMRLQPWWAAVTDVHARAYPTRNEAADAEGARISELEPANNRYLRGGAHVVVLADDAGRPIDQPIIRVRRRSQPLPDG